MRIIRRHFPYLAILFLLFLAACGTANNSGATHSQAARAVEDYLNALVSKDADRTVALSCASWESSARTEVDSFQAVDLRLEDLSCQETGNEGSYTLVTCQGKLLATYNNEDQSLDLSARVYEVEQQGGDFLVCGYR